MAAPLRCGTEPALLCPCHQGQEVLGYLSQVQGQLTSSQVIGASCLAAVSSKGQSQLSQGLENGRAGLASPLDFMVHGSHGPLW